MMPAGSRTQGCASIQACASNQCYTVYIKKENLGEIAWKRCFALLLCMWCLLWWLLYPHTYMRRAFPAKSGWNWGGCHCDTCFALSDDRFKNDIWSMQGKVRCPDEINDDLLSQVVLKSTGPWPTISWSIIPTLSWSGSVSAWVPTLSSSTWEKMSRIRRSSSHACPFARATAPTSKYSGL